MPDGDHENESVSLDERTRRRTSVRQIECPPSTLLRRSFGTPQNSRINSGTNTMFDLVGSDGAGSYQASMRLDQSGRSANGQRRGPHGLETDPSGAVQSDVTCEH